MIEYLVVDDSAAVRAMLRAAIVQARPASTVQEAETAEAALHIMADGTQRVVFLDMMLTDQGGGANVAQQILAQAPETRVIITTGLASDHADVTSVINMGAFAYLQKPIRKEAINAVLDDIDQEDNRLNRIR